MATRIRKPIDELTPADLDAFPIWRFISDEGDETLGDEEDETWVTPLDLPFVPDDVALLSVSAVFTTPGGRELAGIVQVGTERDVELGHAALLVEGQYLFLPTPEFRDADDEYEGVAEQLGLPRDEVFPLAFRLKVPVGEALQVVAGSFIG